MSNHDGPGHHLTPAERRVWGAVIIVGFLLLVALALTDHVGAAAPCPNGALPVYVPRCKQVCVLGRCGRVCNGWDTYCRYPKAGRTAGLAAPLPGNRGGCGRNNRNMRYGLTCNVSDAGPGFVSGTCDYGFWFSRVSTGRTFVIDQALIVDGCEGIGSELYAPITIRKAR